jgi:co-chaperonin GroES (HSP10)
VWLVAKNLSSFEIRELILLTPSISINDISIYTRLYCNAAKKKENMIKALGKKIIVELIEKEAVSAGGIVLTRTDSDEVTRGVVLAVGPEVVDIFFGDVILANWNKGQKMKVEDLDAYVVSEEDVVLVFED